MSTAPPKSLKNVVPEKSQVGAPDVPTAEDEVSHLAADKRYQGIKSKRQSDFKGHVHWASIVALWLGLSFYCIAVIVWFFHLIGPSSLHFMPKENFGVLQNLLFGTIVGAMVSQFARKLFDD